MVLSSLIKRDIPLLWSQFEISPEDIQLDNKQASSEIRADSDGSKDR